MRHALRVVGSVIREQWKRHTRSGKWRALEKQWLHWHPSCDACGSRRHVQVHHVQPFSKHPELELNPCNLISLCMDKPECHLRIGHLGNWRTANPNVCEEAAAVRRRRWTV